MEKKKEESVTVKMLENKVKQIAWKYAELTEKRLISALNEPEVESTAMAEINDGIRMLNHVVATLERVSRLNNCDGSVS